MEVELLESREQSLRKKSKPRTITWNGVKMVRDHSIRQVANEITNMSSNQDFISINVIGKQSTGKTVLAKTMAHLIHTMGEEKYGINYEVLVIGKNEFINLEQTMADLKPTNYIIIFDDIAFLKAGASQQQIEQMQYVLSIIRHLPGGKDVRIIIFKSFQYSKAIPPFLRQNDATFISSVDDAEYKNLLDLVGTKNKSKLDLLKKCRQQLKLGTKDNAYFDYPFGGAKKKSQAEYHRYHAMHPFLPFLYFNGVYCNFKVSPKREWFDPICYKCDQKDGERNYTSKTFDEFILDFEKRYGQQNNIKKQIIKTVAIKRGINLMTRNVKAGVKLLEMYLDKGGITIQQVMNHYQMDEKQFQLRNQPKFEVKMKETDEEE